MLPIVIDSVSKRFGSHIVLDDISLELPAGSMTAIVGPSGVGKSVLLKLILGILTPEHGRIFIGNDEITAAKTEDEKNKIRATLGVLFQGAALLDSLSIYENVAFPLQVRTSLSKEVIHEKVCDMLSSLSLTSYAMKLPQEIPLGTRKRVGLARALILQPKVVLFDEPNTGLDPAVGQEVYEVIQACHKRYHFTGIVISHEIPEVFQVVDRTAMILNGKIRAYGETEILQASSDPAVHQFLEGKLEGPIQIQ